MPDDTCNTDLTDDLALKAAEPKRVEVDGQVVESHSLKDQLAALAFIAANRAGRSRRGFRLLRVIPPGTVE